MAETAGPALSVCIGLLAFALIGGWVWSLVRGGKVVTEQMHGDETAEIEAAARRNERRRNERLADRERRAVAEAEARDHVMFLDPPEAALIRNAYEGRRNNA